MPSGLGSCRSTIELRPQTHVFRFLAPIWLRYHCSTSGGLQISANRPVAGTESRSLLEVASAMQPITPETIARERRERFRVIEGEKLRNNQKRVLQPRIVPRLQDSPYTLVNRCESESNFLATTGRRIMSRDPLVWLAVFLRALLPIPRARKHLTECIGYATVFRVFEPTLPPLLLQHVLGFVALPPLTPPDVGVHPEIERIRRVVGAC
jgi:hypothetical protein